MNEDGRPKAQPEARRRPDRRARSSKRCAARPTSTAIGYLRAVAELDNFRKRSAREVDAARKFGAERLAQAILPVRDSLEAGLGRRPRRPVRRCCSTGSARRCGCSTRRSTPAGIREINPVGELFDPNKHEALSLVPAPDVAPNTVLEVVQKGYELNERLLRAAKVLVARGEGP